MRLRPLLLLAVLCAAGCGRSADDPSHPPPSPALFEITNTAGEREGWLFGTMHAMRDDTIWRTPLLTKTAQKSSVLVVEVASLNDDTAGLRLFEQFATADTPSPLLSRVPANRQSILTDALAATGVNAARFDRFDTWAAAIMLGNAAHSGSAANGADRALISDFAAKPVLELEGTKRQLSIFDALPEQDQQAMLIAVADNIVAGSDSAEQLAEDWRLGRLDSIETASHEGMLQDRRLRHALLVERNRAWAAALERAMPTQPPMLIAVGAAHLPGEDGLAALLESKGYRIRRIQ